MSWLKKQWANACIFFHQIFPPGKVTPENIISWAQDGAACINFARNIASDVKKAGSDPAAIAMVLASSIKSNISSLPHEVLISKEVEQLVVVCTEIIGLPLEQIEAAIKAELGIK